MGDPILVPVSPPDLVVIESAWIQNSGSIGFPKSMAARITFPVAEVTIHFPGRPPRRYYLRVKNIGHGALGVQLGTRVLVEEIGVDTLPLSARVELRPAPADVTDFLTRFKKARAATLPDPDGSFTLRNTKVMHCKGGMRWLRIDADVSRGIQTAGWSSVALVEIGDACFPARLIMGGVDDRTKGRLRITVPADLGEQPDRVDLRLRPAETCSPASPWVEGGLVDLSFFAPEGVLAVGLDAGRLRLMRAARGAIDLRRFMPIDPFFSLVGLYLADGHADGRVCGITGALLEMMRHAHRNVLELIPDHTRVEVAGLRPPGMPHQEAVDLFTAVFGKVDSVTFGVSSKKPTVIVKVNSFLLKELVHQVVAWVRANLSQVPREALVAFVRGYLDGDGGVTANEAGGSRAVLGIYDDDQENLGLIEAALGVIAGWEPGRWRGRIDENARYRTLTFEDCAALLRLGMFKWSMARARLLKAFEDKLRLDSDQYGDLLLELEEIRDAVDGDDRAFYPGRLTPGEKCVPNPTLPVSGSEAALASPGAAWMAHPGFPGESLSLKVWRPPRHGVIEKGIVDRAFAALRASGFPYPQVSLADTAFEMVRLAGDGALVLSHDGRTPRSPRASRVVQAHHPEAFDVACAGRRSPRAGWDDDTVLREAIEECVRYEDRVDPALVLRAVQLHESVQGVTFFAPAAARAVCARLQPQFVVDFCAGWGSRMLGAIAAGVPKYVGVDPATTIMAGNRRLLADVREVLGPLCTGVDLMVGCAEEVLLPGAFAGCDLVFTSPPYFDTEQYAVEPTQSFIRYPELEWWYRGFLDPCIVGAYANLVAGGNLVLNVAPWMKTHVTKLATAAGFQAVDEWALVLTARPYTRDRHGPSRYEPILVFRKPPNRVP